MVISLTPLPPQLSTWFMNDPKVGNDRLNEKKREKIIFCSTNVLFKDNSVIPLERT